MKKILALVLVLMLVTALFVGCGKTQEKVEKKFTVGFSIITLNIPYYAEMQETFIKECNERGWEYVIAEAGMPFRKSARFEVVNECRSRLHLFFYIDYEAVAMLPESTLYFHALWNRECPTDGIPACERSSHKEWILGGEQDKHLSAKGNYVLLDAEGSGQYVGCNINIHNLEPSWRLEIVFSKYPLLVGALQRRFNAGKWFSLQ